MSKVLQVEQDGYLWTAKASQIARNYAINYSDRGDDGSYDENFDAAISDNHILYDWFFSNMDPEDIVWTKELLPAKKVREYPETNREDSTFNLVTI